MRKRKIKQPPEIIEDLAPVEDGRAKPMGEAVKFEGLDAEDAAKRAEEVSQAFGAVPFFWKGTQLAPFAISREADWMRHRQFLGESPLEEIFSQPQAVLPDAIRVLWFCAHDPKEWLSVPSMVPDEAGGWKRLSAQERALVIEEKIRAWGDANVSRQDGTAAVMLFYDIFTGSQSTRATTKPGEHRDEGRAKN